MRQYLSISILYLGAAVLLASCSDGTDLDGGRLRPGEYSDKICFIASANGASRSGSAGSRCCTGAFLYDDNRTDSVYLGLTVAEQDDMPASRAAYITEADYSTLRMTCRERLGEGKGYKYYFSNTKFSKDAAGTWISDPIYWWLDRNTHFSFYGYAPADAEGVKYIYDGDTWEPKLDYRVPDDVTRQSDIIYNTLTQEYIASSNEVVPLSMRHALANVSFCTGKGMAAGKITKVTLHNVITHGTLNLTDSRWSLDASSSGDLSAVIDKTMADNIDITTDADKTYFMLIPGCNSDETTVEIEFTMADGETRTLTGTLNQAWEAGKQYRYTATINPDFTITLDSDIQDAHYVICKAMVDAANMQPGQQWELTATASDGADVTMLPEADLNTYQRNGFWIDEIWEQGVNDEKPNKTNDRARGDHTLTGTGNGHVYIFLPENISNEERTITLTMKVAGGDNIITEKTIAQHCPDWNDNNLGWEVIEEDPLAQWGFLWDRIVKYQKQNIWWNALIYHPIITALVSQYNATNYTSVSAGGILGVGGRTTITIDYTKLTNLSSLGLTSDNGWDNTKKLYEFSGAATTGNLEQAIKNLASRGANGVFDIISEKGENNTTSAVLRYILRKNRYKLVRISKEDNGNVVTTESPAIDASDIVWYLPAQDEFLSTPQKTPLNGDYWSSTPDGNDNAFTSSGSAGRLDWRKIRACRKR